MLNIISMHSKWLGDELNDHYVSANRYGDIRISKTDPNSDMVVHPTDREYDSFVRIQMMCGHCYETSSLIIGRYDGKIHMELHYKGDGYETTMPLKLP